MLRNRGFTWSGMLASHEPEYPIGIPVAIEVAAGVGVNPDRVNRQESADHRIVIALLGVHQPGVRVHFVASVAEAIDRCGIGFAVGRVVIALADDAAGIALGDDAAQGIGVQAADGGGQGFGNRSLLYDSNGKSHRQSKPS